MKLLFLILGSCALVLGQPRVARSGVVNGASYLPPGLVHSGIAQGSIFTIFGQGLGPALLVTAPRLPLGTELSGTKVTITAAGRDYAAFLLYSSASQVSAILPSAVPEGTAQLRVEYGGAGSTPQAIQVRKSAFGIFTQNQAGFGPAIIQNYVSPTVAPQLNGLIQGIQPGQIAILWGTGLGPINGSDSERPGAGNLPVEVEVLVGGRPGRILYQGRSPDFPGLDQINFEVPEGLFGCYVPLAVRAGGVMSNFASLSVIRGGASCGDDVSFRGPNLAAGATRGVIRIGIIELEHTEFSIPPQSSGRLVGGGERACPVDAAAKPQP